KGGLGMTGNLGRFLEKQYRLPTEGNDSRTVCPKERLTMNYLEWHQLRSFAIGTLVFVAAVIFGPATAPAQAPSAAVTKIENYYQQLMPTIQQAARLSVRERDKRFAPVITAVFDIPTMARLAVGPPWKTFSPEQQAAVREAFARFIVADYASQIKDYSGESF